LVCKKIERVSYCGKPAIRVIGSLQSEHFAQIQAEMAAETPASVLDLEELMSVDLEVVQFLCPCEALGVEIVHCSPYVLEWMRQERKPQPDRTE
jgi:hypothetical protein